MQTELKYHNDFIKNKQNTELKANAHLGGGSADYKVSIENSVVNLYILKRVSEAQTAEVAPS